MTARSEASALPRLPILDESRCTGCADCVQVCPASCLNMVGALAWLPRPADCVSCALCVLVCPVDAIQLGAPASL